MRAFLYTLKKNPGCAVTRAGVTKSLRHYSNGIPIELIDLSELYLSSTGSCSADWRRWWAAEAERIGTNRRSLIELHFQICDRLRASSSSWRRPS
jgi:hypothetical protein